jgi:hypothetical protein
MPHIRSTAKKNHRVLRRVRHFYAAEKVPSPERPLKTIGSAFEVIVNGHVSIKVLLLRRIIRSMNPYKTCKVFRQVLPVNYCTRLDAFLTACAGEVGALLSDKRGSHKCLFLGHWTPRGGKCYYKVWFQLHFRKYHDLYTHAHILALDVFF